MTNDTSAGNLAAPEASESIVHRKRQRHGSFVGNAALLLAAGCESSAFAQPRRSGASSPPGLDGGRLGDRAAVVGALRDRNAAPDASSDAPEPPTAIVSPEYVRREVLRRLGTFRRCASGDGGADDFDGACVCRELCTVALPAEVPGDAPSTVEYPRSFRLMFTGRAVTRCLLLHGFAERPTPPEEHLCVPLHGRGR